MDDNKFKLKIYRGVPQKQYWETFELVREPGANVISSLMAIQKNPININGKRVEPVAWEQACLEQVCGSCSILVNGTPVQACTALIEKIIDETSSSTIVLAPFTKFPLIRDLVVDRTSMFEDLKKIEAYNPIETYHSEQFGPNISDSMQDAMYTESTCMTCGCCLEACPQYDQHSDFIGPAAINQVKLFNSNPIGKSLKKSRLHTMMQEGGVSHCGNAQNCVQVCPKKIPLTQSIAKVGGDTSSEVFKRYFGLKESED
jgi:succinate dehydrogenase / fumarate reductase, iron-sulfur subunit